MIAESMARAHLSGPAQPAGARPGPGGAAAARFGETARRPYNRPIMTFSRTLLLLAQLLLDEEPFARGRALA